LTNFFTQTGSYHLENGMKNQDIVRSAKSGRVEMIVLADGVSSCERAREGAQVSCDAVIRLIEKKAEFFFGFTNDSRTRYVMEYVMNDINSIAKHDRRLVDDYSATLMYAIHNRESGEIFLSNLGDGMIIGCKKSGEDILLPPSDSRLGVYVNTSEDACKYTRTKAVSERDYEKIVLCSDGAWRILVTNNRINKDAIRAVREVDDLKMKSYINKNGNGDDCSYICMTIELDRNKGEVQNGEF